MPHPSQGYKLPDGTKVPSVTTVLGKFKEPGGLIWWACQQGQANPDVPVNEALYGTKDKATEIGTIVHSAVERHIKCESVIGVSDGYELSAEGRKKVKSGFQAYLAWERMTRLKITHQEIQLVCPKYRFSGTPDAVGLIDGVPCLIDWKTSKAVYPDMLVQLAAYGWLVEHGLQMEHGYKPLGIKTHGFHLCKFSKQHGDFSHHYFPDLSEAWEQFKRFRLCYDTHLVLQQMAA